MTLNKKKLGKFLGPIQKRVKDRPYTIDEIHSMLNVSDERMKVIVLLLASTGMRLGGLAGLKISCLQKIEQFNLYRVCVYENGAEDISASQLQNVHLQLIFILTLETDLEKNYNQISPLLRRGLNHLDPLSVAHSRLLHVRSYNSIIQDMLEQAGVIRIEP